VARDGFVQHYTPFGISAAGILLNPKLAAVLSPNAIDSRAAKRAKGPAFSVSECWEGIEYHVMLLALLLVVIALEIISLRPDRGTWLGSVY
jgi:hypothetical protein